MLQDEIVQAVLGHETVECAAIGAGGLSSESDVPIIVGQVLRHEPLFEIESSPLFALQECLAGGSSGCGTEIKVVRLDGWAIGQQKSLLNDVQQLPNISGPGEIHHFD